MKTSRFAALAAAAAISVGGIAGVAVAHGGKGGENRGGHHGAKAARCTVPSGTQLLTTADSRHLRKLQRTLDKRVAKGRITQAQADARLQDAATRLTVDKLVAEARIRPVLDLLGTDLAGLKAAREQDLSLLDLARQKGVTVDQLIAAIKQGRADARALRTQLCPRPTKTTTTPTTTTTRTTTGTTTTVAVPPAPPAA